MRKAFSHYRLPNYRLKLSSRRMVARRPSRLALRFRTAARRLRAVLKIGQPARRAGGRRVKPARSLGEERWADLVARAVSREQLLNLPEQFRQIQPGAVELCRYDIEYAWD